MKTKQQEKEQRRQTVRQVLRLIRPYRAKFILSLVLAAAAVALTLYAPVLIGNGVDLIAAPGAGGLRRAGPHFGQAWRHCGADLSGRSGS